MKIYNSGSYGKGTLIVTPANLPHGKDNSDWMDRNSGQPLMFTVRFVKGVAEVDENLGRILCAEKLAYEAPFMQPRGPNILYGRRSSDVAPVSPEAEAALARMQA